MNDPQATRTEAGRHAVPSGLIHDLRNPLNQIIGYSEMLMEERLEPGTDEVAADLKRIHAAGRQMLALVDDSFYPAAAPGSVAGGGTHAEHFSPSRQEPTPQASATNLTTGESISSAAQAAVLVVDDIEANRDVLMRRLKREGFNVAIAENGREAIEKLRAEPFDLVLLDIMMAEMDGYEVLRHLKADAVLRHIPVIMISALGELDSIVRCIEMGAEDYLPKPFNPILLKARIGACLEKKRLRDREVELHGQLQENHQRLQELAAALQIRNTEMAIWRKAQDADLAVARTTQQAIISSPLPRADGWQVEAVYTPLLQVGGDVYGWRQLDHGVWLFWLADATGHGVAAALFTTLVASLFEGASAASARGILTRVSAEFYSALRGRSFLAACCAVIHSDGRLSFAGAGHPPLLIRRGNGSVEAIFSQNTLMGVESAAEMRETITTLGAGDQALLYTDGLHSLRTPDGERFTSSSVSENFGGFDSAPNLLPRLVGQLHQQSDGRGFDDDLAAILLRRG